jgi:hypothetical protein
MNTITTLAMLVILAGAMLAITGFSVVNSVVAQMTGDNATMSENMTGGNMTGRFLNLFIPGLFIISMNFYTMLLCIGKKFFLCFTSHRMCTDWISCVFTIQ